MAVVPWLQVRPLTVSSVSLRQGEHHVSPPCLPPACHHHCHGVGLADGACGDSPRHVHCRPCLTLHCGGVGVSQTVASTELSQARSKLISSDFRILLTSLQPPSETMKPDLVRVELRISESTQIQSYFYKDNFPEHS